MNEIVWCLKLSLFIHAELGALVFLAKVVKEYVWMRPASKLRRRLFPDAPRSPYVMPFAELFIVFLAIFAMVAGPKATWDVCFGKHREIWEEWFT